jgi:hypothetical protein
LAAVVIERVHQPIWLRLAWNSIPSLSMTQDFANEPTPYPHQTSRQSS